MIKLQRFITYTNFNKIDNNLIKLKFKINNNNKILITTVKIKSKIQKIRL